MLDAGRVYVAVLGGGLDIAQALEECARDMHEALTQLEKRVFKWEQRHSNQFPEFLKSLA